GLKLSKTTKSYDVAITQTHHSYEGRHIIREYTLDEFAKNPNALLEEREEEIGKFGELPWEKKGHGEGHPSDHEAVGVASGNAENGRTESSI
ncbi:hypothetical protein OFN61_31490, partial [Escherichia coli]|nr:hypothetical protein [Escherichia coli]